jgi:type I restriction enzyme S subunit
MSEWIEKQIGEIGYFKTSGVDKVIKPDEHIVRLVNYMDVYSSVRIDKGFYLSETSATQHEIDAFDLKKGDVLFTPTSETPDDIGHSSVVIEDLDNTLYSYHLTRFREFEEKQLDDEFKAYCFNQYYVLHQFEKKAAGTTRFTLTRGSFETTYLRFPEDKGVQNKIAKILFTADAVIEKTQDAIAKYKAIKQGMLQDLFTRGIDVNTNKLRPRYEDAPELYKEGKLGWIPREWEDKSIKSIGEIVTGSTPPTARAEYYGDAFLFVSPADIQDNFFIQETGKKLTQSGFDVTRKLPVNSICVVCIGSTIGKMALLAKEGCTNQQINSVICHDPELSFYFFYSMMFYNEPQFRRETGLQAVPIVNKSQFSEFLLPVAEKTEALKIAERLKAIDNKLQTELTYLQKMQSLKKGLMEDLLSGRKQVKINEATTV